MDITVTGNWLDNFTAREKKEIDFALLYAELYGHGSPGHTHLMIIAKLANLLDAKSNVKVEHKLQTILTSLKETNS